MRVFCNGLSADGRSILDLLMLAAECGARLEVEANGADAEAAALASPRLVEAAFHDDEAGPAGVPGR